LRSTTTAELCFRALLAKPEEYVEKVERLIQEGRVEGPNRG
jgi:hypothetical protein